MPIKKNFSRISFTCYFRHHILNNYEMQAQPSIEILKYQALESGDLGYGGVDFCQLLTLNGHTSRFYCVNTIIWKRAGTVHQIGARYPCL